MNLYFAVATFCTTISGHEYQDKRNYMTVLYKSILIVDICVCKAAYKVVSVTHWATISIFNELKFSIAPTSHVGERSHIDDPHLDESPYGTAIGDVLSNFHWDASNTATINLTAIVMSCHRMRCFRNERLQWRWTNTSLQNYLQLADRLKKL